MTESGGHGGGGLHAPFDMFGLSGRVAVVTGGLGQLGRQYCRTLAGAGARVAALDLAADEDAVSRAFPDLAGTPACPLGITADVTDKASLEAALARVCEVAGTPDVLINNAALDSPPNAPLEENGPFETYPVESWQRVFEVNAQGVFLCCQVFGGAMAAAGRGSIVNVASIYGLVAPDQSLYQYRRDRGEEFYKPVAYSASKSALYNLTRYLAGYWGRKGVRVNTVTLAGVFNNQDPAFLASYEPRVPLGRMADESDYNGVILFLASDASRYVTGSNLTADGGWTAW
ncbi:MAG: SDR family oxidoreductase [Thalassobaculum sp.]|uniref:SDR family oxidoreductase n=1 Tax=Thalassobaculum sp. TaxID=2022740 RepID=UPI0032EB438D